MICRLFLPCVIRPAFHKLFLRTPSQHPASSCASTQGLLQLINRPQPRLSIARPRTRLVHDLDNARSCHAKFIKTCLARLDYRLKLLFIPAYCAHLNLIKRLGVMMNRHVTHNKCYVSFTEFSSAMLNVLRKDKPDNFCYSWVRPIMISCFALRSSAPARGSSGYRLTSTRFTMRQDGAYDPGYLVGHRNGRDLPRSALQQLQDRYSCPIAA